MNKPTVDTAPILRATLRDLRQLCRALNTFIEETTPKDVTETERKIRTQVCNAVVDVYHNLSSYSHTLDESMCRIDAIERSQDDR